ncbi:hypothetical protein WICPIJ_009778 [Wickerhamomyces pijperi]|uniref:CWH43-like N-terminal domain-containing protein n=1 Tax=Wickerhamomyces pijperi TaxID=599730 RepID=A0A9P8PKU4_WICPI|nr:hypothetical protein WICPIJ_009778 [Wickerhamomyces pijperi]
MPTAKFFTSPYIPFLPLVSAVSWGGMLIALLVCWSVQGKPIYSWMDHYSNPVYISDIGATNLQPVFISFVCLSCLVHFFSVGCMLYLRIFYQGVQRDVKWVGIVGLVFLGISQIGITCVSCFNTHIFQHVHAAFLAIFIVGMFIALVFQVTELCLLSAQLKKQDQELNWHKNRYNVLGSLKVIFLVFAVIFAICFGSISSNKERSIVTRFEWILSFWYCFLFPIYSLEYYWLLKYDIKIMQDCGRIDSPDIGSEIKSS